MNCLLEQSLVEKMVEQFDSPLYVFHENEFVENYKNLLTAFRNVYPKYNIGYSYKTNYAPYICKIVKSLGGYAEVVSEMEYELAKKIGYENCEIIFNGPIKGKGLSSHLLFGGVANIDSLDELDEVIDLAKENADKIIKIAFRVNIDIGQGFISRFGLDAYEASEGTSEIDEAFTRLSPINNITVVGLHCHVGKSRDLNAWQNRVRIMFNLVDRYFKDNIEFIDFGSGMNSVMEPELSKQFAGSIPSFDEYAIVLAGAMKEKYGKLPYEKQPWLFTEPGTTLVSGAMSFLATVKSIKQVKEKQYVTFDCSGGNMGDICHLKQLPISVYHNHKKGSISCKNATFVGYTCLEHDHIYEGFDGKLAVGDIVQFRNIGSYSNVFKPPFILPNCAMIAFDKDKQRTQLIKNKETFDDVFKTYIF